LRSEKRKAKNEKLRLLPFFAFHFSLFARSAMQIVHLSTSDSGGGAFRAAYRLHSGLRRLGHDSKMLVLRKGTGDEHVIPLKPRQDLLGRFARRRRAGRIWRDYEKYRPTIPAGVEPFTDSRSAFPELVDQLAPCDVINLHWIGGLLDWGSFFARAPHVPIVWRLADMGVLTGGCHYDQGCGRFARGCGKCPQLGSTNELDLSKRIWMDKAMSLRREIHLVGTSRWIAGEARKSGVFPNVEVSIIPNGLDIEEFAPRDKGFCRDLWGIGRDANVVLFAAESVANIRKGFAHLADALAGMRGIENLLLVSVGGGQCDLPAGLNHLPLGRVNNDRMLSTIYSAADVFVIPSLQESFGQTVIESLACGTPVVGFASGGIVDMVRPGETGWLAPTGDTAGLREAILESLRDPRRQAMGQHCRRVAVEEYSLDVQARAYLQLYETLLARVRNSTVIDPRDSREPSPVPAALRPGA
jgi:glycosyltransferase involved in cell wall biosynthesis